MSVCRFVQRLTCFAFGFCVAHFSLVPSLETWSRGVAELGSDSRFSAAGISVGSELAVRPVENCDVFDIAPIAANSVLHFVSVLTLPFQKDPALLSFMGLADSERMGGKDDNDQGSPAFALVRRGEAFHQSSSGSEGQTLCVLHFETDRSWFTPRLREIANQHVFQSKYFLPGLAVAALVAGACLSDAIV